jgi:[NiFe] hydrogenase assembly HybE family chaperone
MTTPAPLPDSQPVSQPDNQPGSQRGSQHKTQPAEGVVPATTSATATLKPVAQKIIDKKTAMLVAAFDHIHKERMFDVPILNDKVQVAVIGFQQWQNSYICIMITPWFMNLMLLPGEEENWDDMRETTASRHTFPSGNYEFLVGFEPDIGKYQMCSLFSPMFEFADNEAAVETAQVAIRELMNSENIEQTDIDSAQIEAIWDGTEEHPDKVAAREAAREAAAKAKAEAPPRKPLKERMEEPVSRRRLLRGALMLEDDEKIDTPQTSVNQTNVNMNNTGTKLAVSKTTTDSQNSK